MATENEPAKPSKALWRIGLVLSALPVALLVFSAGYKLVKSAEVNALMAEQGWPEGIAVPLGIVELASTVLYVIPQTAVLGAILLTGYLGGAVATHVRMSESFAIPVAVGVAVWLGLYLRDARIRALLPWRWL
jgi:hypothetical protein